MSEIKFSPELEKFIEDKKTEIEQKIFSSKYPLSVDDFAALAWKWMAHKYPAETKNISQVEATEALSFEILKLINNDKLYLNDWITGHDGGLIARYRVAK